MFSLSETFSAAYLIKSVLSNVWNCFLAHLNYFTFLCFVNLVFVLLQSICLAFVLRYSFCFVPVVFVCLFFRLRRHLFLIHCTAFDPCLLIVNFLIGFSHWSLSDFMSFRMTLFFLLCCLQVLPKCRCTAPNQDCLEMITFCYATWATSTLPTSPSSWCGTQPSWPPPIRQTWPSNRTGTSTWPGVWSSSPRKGRSTDA